MDYTKHPCAGPPPKEGVKLFAVIARAHVGAGTGSKAGEVHEKEARPHPPKGGHSSTAVYLMKFGAKNSEGDTYASSDGQDSP